MRIRFMSDAPSFQKRTSAPTGRRLDLPAAAQNSYLIGIDRALNTWAGGAFRRIE